MKQVQTKTWALYLWSCHDYDPSILVSLETPLCLYNHYDELVMPTMIFKAVKLVYYLDNDLLFTFYFSGIHLVLHAFCVREGKLVKIWVF